MRFFSAGSIELLSDSDDSGRPSASADPCTSYQPVTDQKPAGAFVPVVAEQVARITSVAPEEPPGSVVACANARACAGPALMDGGVEGGGQPRSSKRMHGGIEVEMEEI